MCETVRVLIVIKSLGPGGAERLVVEQLRRADPKRIRYELFVGTRRTPNLLDEVEALGVPVHLGYEKGMWPLVLRRLVSTGRYQIIHAHLPVAAVGARVVCSIGRTRPRIVYTEHNRWPSYVLPTRVANRATIWLDDLDLAVSGDAAASMRFPAKDAIVVEYGVNPTALRVPADARRRLRVELGVPEEQIVIGTVANFRREKDQGTLLHAFRRADLGGAVTLAFVGQGPLEGELRALVDELGISDRVRFLGYRNDAPAVMAGFDVFALPSAHEGRPVALMEAMTLGLPALVSTAGDMPNMVIDQRSGRVVPIGDVDQLAQAIAGLARDEDGRRAMGAAAASAAHAFDGRRAFDEIEDRYERLAISAR